MGEAKRRKKLDPNFGKKRYDIEFFKKSQVDEVLQQKWSEIEIAEKRTAFTCFKFIYNQETCFGLAFINMIKDTLALDYEWILDPEKITKQERINSVLSEQFVSVLRTPRSTSQTGVLTNNTSFTIFADDQRA